MSACTIKLFYSIYQNWQKFSQTKIPLIRQQQFNKISSEKLSDLKLVLKDCEWTKKELELIFSPNQVYSI